MVGGTENSKAFEGRERITGTQTFLQQSLETIQRKDVIHSMENYLALSPDNDQQSNVEKGSEQFNNSTEPNENEAAGGTKEKPSNRKRTPSVMCAKKIIARPRA